MDKGKLLEKKCRDLFKKKELWFHRFYDSHSAGRFLPPQPSDYLVLTPIPIFIECKESEESRVSFTNFRPSQLKAMRDLTKLGVQYYVIILHKKRLYLLFTGSELLDMLNMGKKSIDIKGKVGNFSIEELFQGILYK